MDPSDPRHPYNIYKPTVFKERDTVPPIARARMKIEKPFPFTTEINRILKEMGRGPEQWHRANKWACHVKPVGPSMFEVGAGSKPVLIEKRISAPELIDMTLFRKHKKAAGDAWAKRVELMADPQRHTISELREYRGSWVNADDLRLRAREVEILAIIASNPRQITRTFLASFYNTTLPNIERMLRLMNASGVTISVRPALTIQTWGVFNKEAVLKVYTLTEGLDSLIKQTRIVMGSDAFKAGTGLERSKQLSFLQEGWQKIADNN